MVDIEKALPRLRDSRPFPRPTEENSLWGDLALLPEAQSQCLCGGGALVEEGCVCNVEPREVADHGLVVEEALEAALRDLRLVRRVLRRPAGVLEEVAQDGVRHDGVVVAHPDVGPPQLVLRHDLLKPLDQVHLACFNSVHELFTLIMKGRGIELTVRFLQVHGPVQLNVGRNGSVGELIQRLGSAKSCQTYHNRRRSALMWTSGAQFDCVAEIAAENPAEF